MEQKITLTDPDESREKKDSDLNEKGRIQNPNETNAPENVQKKVRENEPGNLERKGAENNDHNQNRKSDLKWNAGLFDRNSDQFPPSSMQHNY